MSQILLAKPTKIPYAKVLRMLPKLLLILPLVFSIFFLGRTSRDLGASLEINAPLRLKFRKVVVPACERSPWKEGEDLVGACPGAFDRYRKAKSMEDCAAACCKLDYCIAWQFRKDVGCLHGGDVRLGMEKDGSEASWCSDHPPRKWQGQHVIQRSGPRIVANRKKTGGCSVNTWNPEETQGQCFGLGDVRKMSKTDPSFVIDSAQSCMEACCADATCGAWQYNDDLGCFYNKQMTACVDVEDPVKFQPFVGRRKFLSYRSYTDVNDQPWFQKLN
mmetsp:Transcript_11965/g.34286  ORF Transcript_11965/g.34286 Transcript_11965/m.34286 type:complete len:275 (+) Transcript_11965:146-970(+)|eukprot:CAMPEP_0172358528 /NCGR_PEP_ID=MMETSP1060-20121228/2826_1 /TAXON_ID=37318 /ORGANISM="Pseudo-nitzschia pungens, Strain cf. cingulata" /LENGTH=274 /DNA_ID=CAMNT_0013079773 /DNA_START=135 /DNA_END=959 /DNA_ORIENTATION=+